MRATCYKPQRWLWRKLLSMIHNKDVSKYNLHVQDVKIATKAQHKILRPMASITLHPSLRCWNVLCNAHQFCCVTPLSAMDSLPESLLLLFPFLYRPFVSLKWKDAYRIQCRRTTVTRECSMTHSLETWDSDFTSGWRTFRQIKMGQKCDWML